MQEKDDEIEPFPLWLVIICAILFCFFMSKVELKPWPTGGRYPAEILQPVTLKMLPDLIDKDTKGIVFIKHGCLNASKDEIEALRDKNSSDKEMYIIGGQPVKIELKLCAE